MSQIADLEADLQELLKLSETAQRTRTKNLLKTEIDNINLLISREKATAPQPVTQPAKPAEEKKTSSASPTLGDFKTLSTYSFDQEGKVVKIYLSLEEIGKLEPSNITFDVKKDSFDLRILGYKNQNWRIAFPRLFSTIDPSQSKFVQKNNTLIIRLQKEKDTRWDQLAYKESALKSDSKPEKEADPSAGLMDMMKKLYSEGDDNMKRTIAEAWSKSQDEKGMPKKGF